MHKRSIGTVALICLAGSLAVDGGARAQSSASPPANPPVTPKPNAETPAGALPRGVVPPPAVDPGMVTPPPAAATPSMPVIKPPPTAR